MRSEAHDGFLDAWRPLIGHTVSPAVPPRRGRKPRIPLTTLLPALTFHVMPHTGTWGEHLFELTGESLAESSWSDRRARLPWQVFADLMGRVLRPRATPRGQPDAFWRGWRLVALDGTPFSLTNTPQVAVATPNARTRRGAAAFAKRTTAVLLDVGVHTPLAAAIGRDDESESRSCPRAVRRPVTGSAAPPETRLNRSAAGVHRRMNSGNFRKALGIGPPPCSC